MASGVIDPFAQGGPLYLNQLSARRVPISMVSAENRIFVLCNDGSIWGRPPYQGSEYRWTRIDDVPQGDSDG